MVPGRRVKKQLGEAGLTEPFGLGDRELHRGGRVRAGRGRRDVPAELVLRVVATDAGEPPDTPGRRLELGEVQLSDLQRPVGERGLASLRELPPFALVVDWLEQVAAA